jgi:hypothetical protein
MKLRKFLKYVNKLDYIKIYSNETEEDVLYEGTILDIPWWIVDCKLAEDPEKDEPVHTWFREAENGPCEGMLVVTVDVINS